MSFKDRVTQRIPKSSDVYDLKPCPCCGEKAELQESRTIRVICLNCGLQTEPLSSITVAIGKWNKRKNEE